ncbi:hypothetical protein CERZMDRAFT_86080 [Cercospora zeae-maydis SCOH1-5]|uniref:Uncharacterized protein n=1 Tax=Cercospora zeae-maydis SCOH1-5 TaxID=717836 RepID=A0A6A6FAA8_9PEZI|nr:hypothetical protein CERZMDRAFT_86080 [Cercospora zeae-maydis SCOH1-5]
MPYGSQMASRPHRLLLATDQTGTKNQAVPDAERSAFSQPRFQASTHSRDLAPSSEAPTTSSSPPRIDFDQANIFQNHALAMPVPTYEASLRNWRQETLSWSPEHLSGALPPIFCSACRTSTPPSSLPGHLNDEDARSGLDGLFAFLGVGSTLPADSVVFDQPQWNEGAGGHPALILCQSTCGHLVFCAQVTSFSQAGGLLAKYANTRHKDIFWRYLAVAHKHGNKSPNGMDLLKCAHDTPKPSFVNLDGGYWIEWRNLTHLRACGPPCRLSPTSFHQATWAYYKAECHRVECEETVAQYSLDSQYATPWYFEEQYTACFPNWQPSAPLNVAAIEFKPAVEMSESLHQFQDSTCFSLNEPPMPFSAYAVDFAPAFANQSWTDPPYLYGDVGPATMGLPYSPLVTCAA